MITVHAGAQSPERLRVLVDNAGAESEPLDLSTVTGAAFLVTRPDGRHYVWDAQIIEQDAFHVLLEHAYAVTDVFAAGEYTIEVSMNVPAGIRRAGPSVLVAT